MNKSIISSGSKESTEAAADILSAGGNAYDATIAGILMSMVAEPGLTSPGGGGFLLAYPESRKPKLFDFFVNMPNKKIQDPDFFQVEVDFGDSQQQFHVGKGSVAVPGTIAGLFHIHKKLGKIPFKEIASPAIESAKKGIKLNCFQEYVFKILEPIFCHTERGRSLFCIGNNLMKEDDIFRMPDFADFLDTLSIEGVDFFYKGEISDIILNAQSNGGLLQRQDLDQYKVIERDPIVTNFYNHHILSNPPMAVSGILIDFTLKLLNLKHSDQSKITLSDLAYAFEVTNMAREKHIHKPADYINFNTVFESYKDIYIKQIEQHSIGGFPEDRFGSTTHISVIDKYGNASSATTTNGEGCGSILPEAGFMMNNMLGEEDLNPDGFFLHPPGTRLPTMMAPTIVLKDGKPVLVTGSAGSNRIRSVIIQMIVNTLCNGMDLVKSTDSPRIHIEGNILHAEPGVPDDELDKLSKHFKIKKWHDKNVFFGGCNSVMNDKGAGDPRRWGYTVTV